MRRPLVCVPTIALCLLLCGCGGKEQEQAAQDARAAYQAAERCEMTAEVSAFYGDERCSFTLRCAYTPEESEVEVLSPETAEGVRAVLNGDGASVVSTLWLREDGGAPVRGEIAVDGKIFLQAEFTDFRFGGILDGSEAAAGSGGE